MAALRCGRRLRGGCGHERRQQARRGGQGLCESGGLRACILPTPWPRTALVQVVQGALQQLEPGVVLAGGGARRPCRQRLLQLRQRGAVVLDDARHGCRLLGGCVAARGASGGRHFAGCCQLRLALNGRDAWAALEPCRT